MQPVSLRSVGRKPVLVWRKSHVTVIDSGESFMALSTGLQAALWALGGVPEEHRTDSLSAAFNNLAEQEELTKRYADLCSHYGLRATRCNPGQSNENGSIESRNNSLKTALDQALCLRGSRSFDTRPDYETFVDTIVQRMNTRAAKFLVTVELPQFTGHFDLLEQGHRLQ